MMESGSRTSTAQSACTIGQSTQWGPKQSARDMEELKILSKTKAWSLSVWKAWADHSLISGESDELCHS